MKKPWKNFKCRRGDGSNKTSTKESRAKQAIHDWDVLSGPWKNDPTKLICYIDGSCLRNPSGPIGAAAVIVDFKYAVKDSLVSGAARGTNNIAELNAYENGLLLMAKHTNKNVKEWHLPTDSNYTIGQLDGGNATHKNVELIGKLKSMKENYIIAYDLSTIEMHWVPGHAGQPGNELADSLAKAEAYRWEHRSGSGSGNGNASGNGNGKGNGNGNGNGRVSGAGDGNGTSNANNTTNNCTNKGTNNGKNNTTNNGKNMMKNLSLLLIARGDCGQRVGHKRKPIDTTTRDPTDSDSESEAIVHRPLKKPVYKKISAMDTIEVTPSAVVLRSTASAVAKITPSTITNTTPPTLISTPTLANPSTLWYRVCCDQRPIRLVLEYTPAYKVETEFERVQQGKKELQALFARSEYQMLEVITNLHYHRSTQLSPIPPSFATPLFQSHRWSFDSTTTPNPDDSILLQNLWFPNRLLPSSSSSVVTAV